MYKCRRQQFHSVVLGLVLGSGLSAELGAVERNLAPVCANAVASQAALWPVNHKMVPITIQGVSDPEGGPVDIALQCILQDEPLDESGDGNTAPDASGINTASAELRSERAGNKNGRVYHVDYIATDNAGWRCAGEVLVRVDKSAKQPAVDDGRLFHAVPSSNPCGIHHINNPTLIESTPLTFVNEGASYRYQLVAFDPDGQPLVYSVESGPPGMRVDAGTGRVEWNEPVGGSYAITLRAMDSEGESVTQRYQLTVNAPPQFTSEAIDFSNEGSPYQYMPSAQDPDSPQLTYTLLLGPPGMTMDTASGAVTWANPVAGTHDVTLRVTDPHGLYAEQRYALFVNATPAIVSHANTLGDQGLTYHYAVTATDPDGEALGFSLSRAPNGLVIDSQSGVVSWATPVAGVYDVTLRATDPLGLYAEQRYSLFINAAPVIDSIANTLGDQGIAYRYAVISTDADGDALGFSLIQAPEGLAIDSQSGVVTWSNPVAGTHEVTLRATDPRGLYAEQRYSLFINAAPAITSPPVVEGLAGVPYAFTLQATDTDGDSLHFELSGAPEGMAVDPATGVVSWQSPVGGTYAVTLRVTDPRGLSDAVSYSLDIDSAPQITSSPVIRAQAGEAYHYLVQAEDPDGDTLGYTLLHAPAEMVIDRVSGEISWEVSVGGEHTVILRVRDPRGLFDEQHYTLTVNRAPRITSTPIVEGKELIPYRYAVTADDADGDTLTYALVNAPAGVVLDAVNGEMLWSDPQGGSHAMVVQVRDPDGRTDEQSYTLGIAFANTAPVIQSQPPLQAIVTQTYRYPVEVSDAEGDSIALSLTQAPQGMVLLGSEVLWTPVPGDEGTHAVTLLATDAQGAAIEQQWSLTVDPRPNTAPSIVSTPPTHVIQSDSYRYAAVVSDAEGDTLAFSLTQAPVGMTVDAEGVVTWPTSGVALGNYPVELAINDGWGGVISQPFVLLVEERPNQPPVLVGNSGLPGAVMAGSDYRVDLTATDPEGEPVTYTLATAPVGMVLDPTTGQLLWQPTQTDVGSHPVSVVIDDGSGSPLTLSWSVLVQSSNATNGAPIFTQAPTTHLRIGEHFVHTLQARDPENDPLSFMLIAAPSGMVLDAEQGTLTWTPTAAQLGAHRLVVAVSDDHYNHREASYSLWIAAADSTNTPPRILSEPVSRAVVGREYRYAVMTQDSDGDVLSYSLDAPVADAYIDPENGLLIWTPSRFGQATLTVKVSDGEADVLQFIELYVSAEASGESPLSVVGYSLTSDSNTPVSLPMALKENPLSATVVFEVTATPQNGTLSGGANAFEYQPAADYIGPDWLAYRAIVNGQPTAPAYIDITVVAQDPTQTTPVIAEQTHYLEEDGEVAFSLTGLKAGEQQFELLTQPLHGDVNGKAPYLTYRPHSNYVGEDQITYKVTTSESVQAEGVIRLVIDARNDAPVITSKQPTPVSSGSRFHYQVEAYDPDDDQLTYSLLSAPEGVAIDPGTGMIALNETAFAPVKAAAFNSQCRINPVNRQHSEPKLKWTVGTSNQFAMPLVGNMRDTNGDGRVDSDDDVVVITTGFVKTFITEYSILVMVHGDTGEVIWKSDIGVRLVQRAFADLDRDGWPEIMLIDNDGYLRILNSHDGTLKYISTYNLDSSGSIFSYRVSSISVADVDSDGFGEILVNGVIFDHQANVERVLLDPSEGVNAAHTQAVDLDLDGQYEVIAANRVYDLSGQERFRFIAMDNSTYHPISYNIAFAGVDDDPYPEVIFTGYGLKYPLI